MTIGKRTWSADDRANIVRLLTAGASVRDIAGRFRCSTEAIYETLYYAGMDVDSIRGQRRGVRTANEVAKLFGVSIWRVTQSWIAGGYLAARRNGVGTRSGTPHYLITYQALVAFLEVRELWPTYRVEDICDPLWREMARWRRAAAGGRWVKLREHVRQQHYDPDYVTRLVKDGRFPGAVKIKNIWYVWEKD